MTRKTLEQMAQEAALEQMAQEAEREPAQQRLMDRRTGELYNPQEAFERIMNTPEVRMSLSRLSIR